MQTSQTIIIGAGITGLACAHRLIRAGHDVLVLEASDRPGGKICTVTENGYQFEAGPNTLLANAQPTLDMIDELNLTDRIVDADPAAKRRFIEYHGKVLAAPSSPIAALTSPLMGIGTMLRVFKDLKRTKPGPQDETVANFITRRFGRKILENLVSPFIAGIYAGDAQRLEAKSVLPKLTQAEREAGSVIRGLIARRKRERGEGRPPLPSRSITFKDGLSEIPAALSQCLGPRLRLATPVDRIEVNNDRCTVYTNSGESLECDNIVIATDVRTGTELIETLPDAANIAKRLRSIPRAGLAVVGFVYDRDTIGHPLDGFGYLAGPGSLGPILGCLFRSSTFPDTCPSGKVMLSTFIGGSLYPEFESLSDEELIDQVHTTMADRLTIKEQPQRTFLRRWPNALPQFHVGHAAIQEEVRQWSSKGPISMIGNAISGLSLNDCITTGRNEADRILNLPKPERETQEATPCLSA